MERIPKTSASPATKYRADVIARPAEWKIAHRPSATAAIPKGMITVAIRLEVPPNATGSTPPIAASAAASQKAQISCRSCPDS